MSETLESELPLGASVLDEGVYFKVWAPHAKAVSVVGDWNDWNPDADPMAQREHGNWDCLCAEARDGSEYKFAIDTGDSVMQKIDPRARKVTNSVGNAVVYADCFDWEDDAYELPPLNQLVIYELHARSFCGEDGEGKATLDEVCAKLDHLQRLGVNAIELMPVAEFAGDLSWGYNPSHPYAVESSYGGPDGLKRLVKEAHRRNIGVVLDVVYNHFGPSDLDLWQFDGWEENGQGGIYFYNDWKAETPWGQTRPDYGRGEVRQYIRDNALMWLEEFRIDGLRYDMTLFMRSVRADGAEELPDGFDLLRWINKDARSLPQNKVLIAEDLQNEPSLTEDIEHGGGGFHAQWDAAFVHPIRAVLIEADDASRSMPAVADALLSRFNGDAFRRVVYTESHDEVANGQARVTHEIDAENETGFHASARASLGIGLTLTAPGVPMLFQGQEFLEEGWFSDDHPLHWSKLEEAEGMMALVQDLVSLRLNKAGQAIGLQGQGIEILHCNDIDKVVAYHRWQDHGEGDDVVVVVNFSHEEKSDYQLGFPAAGKWRCLMNSAAEKYHRSKAFSSQGDLEAGGEAYGDAAASAAIAIAPYSFQIYSLEALKEG
ncbi:alpha-amylase family glycosyl hydrolase [Pelagicoccus sp. SDUM812005]|uniref:alpha-amylase family glycosyl hydrolase n=1 Tax=Pelagicoccus sp. SDUM812005 TaxID=3041257 RepID=UPI00280DF033|nr:alpha-amylase family glycosyl hydrolase [Pelagicoccus sp. SDUM812005]MDQ8181052.1 alpha-amylase family glycosyl hydrolase [Pelagicoccus sp. SDUM812005]